MDKSCTTVIVLAGCLGAGCGEGSSAHPIDSAQADTAQPQPDTSVDAPLVGCPPTPTAGTGASLQIPRANATVIWSNSDGSLRACTQTDANGHTHLPLDEPGSVTWIFPGNSTTFLTTFTGIQPGEVLNFGPPPDLTVPKIRVTYAGAVTNATRYYFDLGCGGTSSAGSSGLDA